MNVLIGACSQLAPRHKQSILDGSISNSASTMPVGGQFELERLWWRLPSVSVAAAIVFALGSRFGDGVRLRDDRKLMLLQVTLGPVLEEILFRGYLFALLLWGFAKASKTRLKVLVVPIAALVFAVVHLSQPGASWLQMVV